MISNLKKLVFHYHPGTPLHYNLGFFLLRLIVGLALCIVFEKLFPKDGIWGPQAWFIEDIANMGFPLPTLFAWIAVLTEFVGGILLMIGLFTRPAAILNMLVTFVSAFIYHEGDIAASGLTAFLFMVMCICISLFGPGKFSLDYWLQTKKKIYVLKMVAIIPLLLTTLSLGAQQMPSSALQNIEGQWKGMLTYTDYGDDISQSTLKCNLETRWKNQKVIFTFKYIEPDGREIKDKTSIKLKQNGTVVNFDGVYQVSDFEDDPVSQGWQLTLTKHGKDNNRDAEIKQEIILTDQQLTIIKEIRYQGTEQFFERNRYLFEKIEG